MSQYLIIESRDPFESPDVSQMYALANDLSTEGNDVTVFLTQNGALATRSGAKAQGFTDLLNNPKIKVLVDDYSLGERGITESELSSGINIATMDQLIDSIVNESPKVVWH